MFWIKKETRETELLNQRQTNECEICHRRYLEELDRLLESHRSKGPSYAEENLRSFQSSLTNLCIKYEKPIRRVV